MNCKKNNVIGTGALCLMLQIFPANAELSAGDYRIESSTVSDGGNESNGTGYIIQSAFGQPSIGMQQAGNYRIYSGFFNPNVDVIFNNRFD